MHYVRKQSEGLDPPATFAANLVAANLSMTAAVQAPAPKATRNKYVDIGTTTEGEEREGPLSNIAQVFYSRATGEWKSRQIQSKANVGGSTGIEYIWQGSGSRGAVVSLASVEVDDAGFIVRILSINTRNLPGGRAQLIDIMTKKGWKLKLQTP